MAETILDLTTNSQKSKQKKLGKELEEEYEFHNSSTSSSSMSENEENISTEEFKNEAKVQSKPLIIPKISLQKNFVSKLMKKGKNSYSSYLNKLINKNLLISTPKKINNIFIFDWDDTLFCTSVLSPNGYFDSEREILPSQLKRIEKLEIFVECILVKSLEKGDTYIISNSEAAWIKYSCEIFFPNVYKLLNKIKIISGRDLYEDKFPQDYKTWKIKAFNNILKNYSLNLPTNIMTFGDSSYDIDASYDLVKKFPNGFIKAIKFQEFPLIQDLIKQLIFVLDNFNIYYSACKNWTINIAENN
jgi:hypothetical protein